MTQASHRLLLLAILLLVAVVAGCEPLGLSPQQVALQRRYIQAVKANDLPSAVACLDEGVNVNARDECGKTAAAVAIDKDFDRMLALLRSRGGAASVQGYG